VDAQPEFLLEIEELVEHIFVDLDELHAASTTPQISGRVARDLLDRLFRHVHSVKGSAASSGLEVVGQIAHEFENLLAEIRAGRILFTGAILAICESAADALAEGVRRAASGTVAPPPGALLERLQTAARTQKVRPGSEGSEMLPGTIPKEMWPGSEAGQQKLRALVAEGSHMFVVTASFELADFAARFRRLQEKLAEFGEAISTSPAVDEAHPEHVTFRILYGSSAPLPELEAAAVDFPGVEFTLLPNATDTEDDSNTSSVFPAPPVTLTNVVRVNLEQLDQLIFRAHLLLTLTLNSIDSASSRIPEGSPAHCDLTNEKERIRASFLRLANDLINLRMVSCGPMLRRAERAAKRGARLAGKEIDCEIVGADLPLDKLVAEAIAGPLIQLVRNAVDHGIESVADRLNSGKRPRGTLRLEAVSEGSQVRLRVVDDGRGIDPVLVSAAAQRLGIVPGDFPLDVDRSLRLIFRPGFTTLAAVSDVSGRGVGLDIVETAVEQVGGELRVSSQPGTGTTFEIRLPVTFGLLDATVVVSAGQRYCIPTNQIVATGRMEIPAPDKLSVIPLRDLLGQPSGTPPDSYSSANLPSKEASLITCEYRVEPAGASGNGRDRVALVVDAVAGKEEVLVRNLGRHAGRWSGVAGATELRDGTVALVLDLPRLLAH
jgi:two-component system chemotaxis sensor kinase CheA